VIRLERPFHAVLGSNDLPAPNNRAFSTRMRALENLSDTMEQPDQSPFILYEDTRPLGPPHTAHALIVRYGAGRFSHWSRSGFIFSSSDGTNPDYNGRTYWAVIPTPAAK
jgi:hypothetical protein